jgi:ribosomal protein L15E
MTRAKSTGEQEVVMELARERAKEWRKEAQESRAEGSRDSELVQESRGWPHHVCYKGNVYRLA